jgi:hypothetical protein
MGAECPHLSAELVAIKQDILLDRMVRRLLPLDHQARHPLDDVEGGRVIGQMGYAGEQSDAEEKHARKGEEGRQHLLHDIAPLLSGLISVRKIDTWRFEEIIPNRVGRHDDAPRPFRNDDHIMDMRRERSVLGQNDDLFTSRPNDWHTDSHKPTPPFEAAKKKRP